MATIQKITPMLWFDGQAEGAARFYTGISATSIRPHRSLRPRRGFGGYGAHRRVHPRGPAVHRAQRRPQFTFTPAISFVVHCETQEEVDHYWDALTVAAATCSAAVRLARGQVRRVVADRAGGAAAVPHGPRPREGRSARCRR